MRTQLLCVFAFLCGAGVASAQGWPANAGTWPSGYTGYSQGGYPAGYYGYSNNSYYNPYAYSQYYQQYMAQMAGAGAGAGPVGSADDGPVDGGAPVAGGAGCRWWLTGEYLFAWL